MNAEVIAALRTDIHIGVQVLFPNIGTARVAFCEKTFRADGLFSLTGIRDRAPFFLKPTHTHHHNSNGWAVCQVYLESGT